MSFQIRDIVLYSSTGSLRRIELELGKVNIILGESGVGKTALINIIDYCLASDSCQVYRGPIRQAVSWYGLRLQLKKGQMFVARRAPNSGESTSSDVYVELGGELEVPEYAKLSSSMNFESFKQLLTRQVGIVENLTVPREGSGLAPLAANIRHSLFYAFQPQYDLINPDFLFHDQSEEWIPLTIRRTLPYFLGAVSDDNIAMQNELSRLNPELRRKELRLKEAEALKGSGFGRANTLILEAQNTGLLEPDAEAKDIETAIALLEKASQKIDTVDNGLDFDDAGLNPLLRENEELRQRRRRLKDHIGAVEALAKDQSGFTHEVSEQVARLKAVEMFQPPSDNGDHVCPLCLNSVTDPPPSHDALQTSLKQLSNLLKNASTGAPRYAETIGNLRTAEADLKRRIAENNEKIDTLRALEDRAHDLRSVATRQAHVLGRISLYLESVPSSTDGVDGLKASVEQLRKRITRLKEILSDEKTLERQQSYLNQIGSKMTKWGAELRLEQSEYPLRLDLNKLTVIADTLEGPVPINLIGSGENWVGYHIIAHFALHEWFTRKKRPVPRFLFLDQPSQVYFPSELDPVKTPEKVREGDWASLVRMFEFIFKFVESLKSQFQLIITEHAEINEPWFQEAIRQRWRDGVKLVPAEWLTQQGQLTDESN